MTVIDGATMLTHSGEYVQPLWPDTFTPRIEDIAHALSNLGRFTGHTSEFYSVAQHSCYVAALLPPGLELAGMLHDASEAYLGDMATPLKRHPFFGSAYRSAERALTARIEEVFGVNTDHDLVHHADKRMLATERRDLMPDVEGEWLILRGVKPLADLIVPWPPAQARLTFLAMFQTFSGQMTVDECIAETAA